MLARLRTVMKCYSNVLKRTENKLKKAQRAQHIVQKSYPPHPHPALFLQAFTIQITDALQGFYCLLENWRTCGHQPQYLSSHQPAAGRQFFF